MLGRLLRTISLLSALATATMPGALAVAEGVIQATATAATAHVEPAGGSDSCPVAHDAHCAACSLLRHGYTGPASELEAGVPGRCAEGQPDALVALAGGRLHLSANPRAPPAT